MQDTSDSANPKPMILQMDPGQLSYRFYTITDNSSNTIGKVLVPAENVTISGTPYYAGTEYWFDVTTSTPSTSITFSWTDYSATSSPPTLGTQSFTMTRTPSWSTGAPSNASNVFVSNTIGIALKWELSYADNRWSGDVVWYVVTLQQQNTAFGGTTSSPQTLTASTSPNPTWYNATVAPS